MTRGVVMCPVAAELAESLRGQGQVYERVRIWIDEDDVISIQNLAGATEVAHLQSVNGTLWAEIDMLRKALADRRETKDEE